MIRGKQIVIPDKWKFAEVALSDFGRTEAVAGLISHPDVPPEIRDWLMKTFVPEPEMPEKWKRLKMRIADVPGETVNNLSYRDLANHVNAAVDHAFALHLASKQVSP